jgi:hypothetical protein
MATAYWPCGSLLYMVASNSGSPTCPCFFHSNHSHNLNIAALQHAATGCCLFTVRCPPHTHGVNRFQACQRWGGTFISHFKHSARTALSVAPVMSSSALTSAAHPLSTPLSST